MPKPDEINIGGKVGLSGILEFLISGKFTPKDFRITEPEEKETSELEIYIYGLGAHPESRVILINQVLGGGYYLQGDIGYPNSNGQWQALTKFSESTSGKERIIFAVAVKESDVKRVSELFNRSGKIKKIAEFEAILRDKKIRYKISIGKKLVYRKRSSTNTTETTQTKNLVLHHEKKKRINASRTQNK